LPFPFPFLPLPSLTPPPSPPSPPSSPLSSFSPFPPPQALLQAVNNASGREDIIEPAVCALRHITSRHPSADMAQNTVRQVGGIPVISAFLHQQCRWPLLKGLVGLIRNLALCPENHFHLRQQAVIPKLWNILTRAYTNSSKRGVPGGPQGLIVS
ncbi:Catenin beta-1, partial [Geodia barretti]